MQPDCWQDPALCSVVLRRVKNLQRVEQEQVAAEARMQEIVAATACVSPILDVTDVRCKDPQQIMHIAVGETPQLGVYVSGFVYVQ